MNRQELIKKLIELDPHNAALMLAIEEAFDTIDQNMIDILREALAEY